jgi:hypothetical protein
LRGLRSRTAYVQGVKDVQGQVQELGATINPTKEQGYGLELMHNVEFDVAVTVMRGEQPTSFNLQVAGWGGGIGDGHE